MFEFILLVVLLTLNISGLVLIYKELKSFIIKYYVYIIKVFSTLP